VVGFVDLGVVIVDGDDHRLIVARHHDVAGIISPPRIPQEQKLWIRLLFGVLPDDRSR